MGETCGMKMVYSTIRLQDKCKLCLKIEAKQRRLAKHISDIQRWRSEPEKWSANIAKAAEEALKLQSDIQTLVDEKAGKYKMIGNTRR